MSTDEPKLTVVTNPFDRGIFRWDVPLQFEDGAVMDYRVTARWSPAKDYVATGVVGAAVGMASFEFKKRCAATGPAVLISPGGGVAEPQMSLVGEVGPELFDPAA